MVLKAGAKQSRIAGREELQDATKWFKEPGRDQKKATLVWPVN